MKSYTDLEQSKKLAEFLSLESADMTLPFRHPKKDEYIPGYVVSRNYVEVYNEMMKLPAMEKEDVCKLIQPSWSLAALLTAIPIEHNLHGFLTENGMVYRVETLYAGNSKSYNNPVDACYEMIIKLHEQKNFCNYGLRKEIQKGS